MKGPRRQRRSRITSNRFGGPKASKNPVSVGEEYNVEIVAVTSQGKGVAKIKGFTIIVDNTSPGDRVMIRITKMGNSHADAKVFSQKSCVSDIVPIQDGETQILTI